MFADKQTYFENHYHQKNSYGENNLNQMLEVLLFYLALLFVLLFLLILQVLCLNQNFFTRLELLDLSTIFSCLLYLCLKYVTRKFVIISSRKVLSLDFLYFSIIICFL